MTTPSELEGCVLGIVAQDGPITPYAIRKVFLDSPSRNWSGSAGAIYPLVRRLETAGLVVSRSSTTGSRSSRLYLLTRKGEAALREWIGPPLAEWVVAVPSDALRTRLSFLSVLSGTERDAFLRDAQAGLEAQLRLVAADHERARMGDDPFSRLVSQGAFMMLQTRMRWFQEVAASLKSLEK